jgi:D-sedoheptulose 7-phosphate isomerase
MNNIIEYINGVQFSLDNLPLDRIERAIEILYKARLENRQIFVMGNGGSASTASHFVCDLSKNTRKPGWPNFRVIGLTDNMALITAYANDEGYENVFAQQLASFVQPGDVVIGISASGKSPNVLNAIELANRVNATTIGFTGFDGGRLGKMVSLDLHVPSNIIQHVEDVHMMLEHMICKALCNMIDTTAISLEPATYLPQELEHIELNMDVSGPVPVVMTDFHRVERNQAMLGLLEAVENELTQANSPSEFLLRVLQVTLDHIGASSGSIVVLDKNGNPIEGALAYDGKAQFYTAQKFNDIAQHGLIGWVAQNRQAALVQSTSDDPRWLRRSWESSENRSRSAISVPLTADDQVVGVVTLVGSHVRQFTLEDMAMLTAIAINLSLHQSKLLKIFRDR